MTYEKDCKLTKTVHNFILHMVCPAQLSLSLLPFKGVNIAMAHSRLNTALISLLTYSVFINAEFPITLLRSNG